MRIGNGEIRSTFTPHPNPSGHFAVDLHDWDDIICKLGSLGVEYTPPSGREYGGGYSAGIKDPDGNMIELAQHPLGRLDSKGNTVEIAHDPDGMVWTRRPGYGPTTG